MVQKMEDLPLRRRGRPRSFDEAEVLGRIRDVFWTSGYAATSLDDLVAATGLSRPSLYAAFGDKHAVYLRALKETSEWALGRIHLALEGHSALADDLLDLFIQAMDSTLAGDAGARGCFIMCIAIADAVRDTDARAIASDYVAELDALFKERFTRSANELRPGLEPIAAATMATAMLQTMAVRARTGANRDELMDVARSAVSMICGSGGTTGERADGNRNNPVRH